MSEFKFPFGASSRSFLTFQIGFRAEVEAVNGWNLNAIPNLFIPIPSGPLLVAIVSQSIGETSIKIAESDDSGSVAQWVTASGSYTSPGLRVRTINVPAGAEYTAYHNVNRKFVGMVVMGLDDFEVQAVGIPERAPATLLKNPNQEFGGGM